MDRRRESATEGERGGRAAGHALAASGLPMLGVALAEVSTDGFSWGDLGGWVAIWAFFFLVLMAFSGHLRPPRRR